MKAYLQFINMCYTGLGVIKLLVIIGLLFFIPVLFVEDGELRRMCIYIGSFLSFGLPYTVAAGSFKIIISNRRFSLLPNFHIKIGLSLFIYTIFISVIFAGLAVLSLNDPLMSGIGMFIAASLFIAFLQVMYSSFIHPSLVPMVIVGIAFLPNILGIELHEALLSDFAIYGYFVFILVAWACALYILSWKRVFTMHKAMKNVLVGSSMAGVDGNSVWEDSSFLKIFSANKIASPLGTLLKNYPDNLYNRFIRTAGAVVLFPTLGITILFLLEGPADNNSLEFLKILLIPAVIMTAVISTLQVVEWVARARYAWLRSNQNRGQIWQEIDQQVLQYLVLIYCAVFCMTGLLVYIGEISIINYLHVMTTTICISIFYIYFSLFFKITKLDILYAWGTLIFMCVLIAGLFIPFMTERFIIFGLVQIMLVLMGAFFRTKSCLNFKRIDWTYVKPIRRVGGRLQTL